jgi:hypothetical protein
MVLQENHSIFLPGTCLMKVTPGCPSMLQAAPAPANQAHRKQAKPRNSSGRAWVVIMLAKGQQQQQQAAGSAFFTSKYGDITATPTSPPPPPLHRAARRQSHAQRGGRSSSRRSTNTSRVGDVAPHVRDVRVIDEGGRDRTPKALTTLRSVGQRGTTQEEDPTPLSESSDNFLDRMSSANFSQHGWGSEAGSCCETPHNEPADPSDGDAGGQPAAGTRQACLLAVQPLSHDDAPAGTGDGRPGSTQVMCYASSREQHINLPACGHL